MDCRSHYTLRSWCGVFRQALQSREMSGLGLNRLLVDQKWGIQTGIVAWGRWRVKAGASWPANPQYTCIDCVGGPYEPEVLRVPVMYPS